MEPNPDPRACEPYRCAALVALAGVVAGFTVVSLPGPAWWHRSPVLLLWGSALPLGLAGLGAAGIALLQPDGGGGRRWDRLRLGPIPGWSALAFPALLLVPLYPLSMVATALSEAALLRLGWTLRVPVLAELLNTECDPWFRLSAAVVALLVAPVAEEIVFRLVLYEAICVASPRAATWVTAGAFASVHQIPQQVLALLVLGLVLQWVRRRAGGSLWPCLTLHIGFNAISLVLASRGTG